MPMRSLLLGLMTTAAVGAFAGAALADPPSLVGRVSYTEGDVSMLPPEDEDWTQAERNYPVAPGESYWTGDGGRAELEIGDIEARLDNETELDILALDYGDVRLSLPQGSMELRLWSAPEGGVTIATPVGEVHLRDAGVYRIDVGAPSDDGDYPPVQVTVFRGSADVPSSNGVAGVEEGEAALLYADYDPEYQDANDASIDDWARDREDRNRYAQNQRYDDYADMTGADDLYQYGDYEDSADYGRVWYPRDVPSDWAPYRYGHWANVQPWGWTWIDDQSWGFAPFHYGRWARINGRWGWTPGERSRRPVYAPALVAFIGGRGWSFGGGEATGWVPLAPNEVYRPGYRVSDTYVRQLNATNVRGGNFSATPGGGVGGYRNARAATVVRSDAFTRGGAVQKSVIAAPAGALSQAPVSNPADQPTPPPHTRRVEGQGGGQGAAGGGTPPPRRLRAVGAAIAAQPAGATAPPVIPGAHAGPPRPHDTTDHTATLVAPSQLHHPGQQHRQPLSTVEGAIATPPGASPADAAAAAAARDARIKARQAARLQSGSPDAGQPGTPRDGAPRRVGPAAAGADTSGPPAGAPGDDAARQARIRARDAAGSQVHNPPPPPPPVMHGADQSGADVQAAARAKAAADAQAAAQAKARADRDAARRLELQRQSDAAAQAKSKADAEAGAAAGAGDGQPHAHRRPAGGPQGGAPQGGAPQGAGPQAGGPQAGGAQAGGNQPGDRAAARAAARAKAEADAKKKADDAAAGAAKP